MAQTAKKKQQNTKSSARNTGRGAKQPVKPSGGSQAVSVLLFFLSILLFLFALIPGQRVWNDFHLFLHGIFGFTAYLFPLLFMFITVYDAFRKPSALVKWKFAGTAVLLWLLSAFIDVLCEHTADFGEYVSLAYSSDRIMKGGWLGAIIGWPFQNWFGAAGAAVILGVVVLTLLLLTTGTSLVQIMRPVIGSAQRVRDNTAEIMERRRIAEENRKKSFDVSIEGMPDEPADPIKHDPADIETKKDRLINSYHSAHSKDADADAPEDTLPEENSTVQQGTGENTEPDVLTETESKEDIDEIIRRLKKDTAPIKKKEEKPAAPVEKKENTDASVFTVEVQTEPPAEEYVAPSFDLLDEGKSEDSFDIGDELKQNADLLINTLRSFGVEARIINISRGPSVTRYELQPAAGVKISKITNLSDDIALNLATAGVRIEAPIPNKAAIGIEVPNKKTSSVNFRDVVDNARFTDAKSKLTVALGKDIAGNVVVTDLTKMPHLLIAGTTGSGKSVCVNSMIMSVLYKANPDEVKMLLIDPKVVELQEYNGIPHLLVPVVTDPKKAAGALGWAVNEMLRRYKTFAECNVRDIGSYNQYAKSFNETREQNIADGEEPRPALDNMPHILIVIEELADLMMAAPNEVEDSICRLAQMARAAGMHLVIATQRPSVDVVTGLIKANIPSRVALKTSNQFDSRTIIDSSGAEKLLGRGDMLFYPVGANKPTRVQGCWVSPREIGAVIGFLKKKKTAEYSDSVMTELDNFVLPEKGSKKLKGGSEDGDFSGSDELLEDAIECVVESGLGSVSLLQRKLQVGHSRSGRLMDLMEERGIVGPFEGSKPRKVLVTKQQWYEMKNSGALDNDNE